MTGFDSGVPSIRVSSIIYGLLKWMLQLSRTWGYPLPGFSPPRILQALFGGTRLIYKAWLTWIEAGYLADLVDNIRVQILEQASTRKAQSNARRTYHEPICYLVVPSCGPASSCIEASTDTGSNWVGFESAATNRTTLHTCVSTLQLFTRLPILAG